MGLFSWLGGGDPFCRNEFKPLFSSFVDTVVDTLVAGGPVVTPPRPHTAAAPRYKATLPAAKRLVAIGDIHGDMKQMKKVLQASGLIDEQFRWAGGDTVAVQVSATFAYATASSNGHPS